MNCGGWSLTDIANGNWMRYLPVALYGKPIGFFGENRWSPILVKTKRVSMHVCTLCMCVWYILNVRMYICLDICWCPSRVWAALVGIVTCAFENAKHKGRLWNGSRRFLYNLLLYFGRMKVYYSDRIQSKQSFRNLFAHVIMF